MIETWKKRGIFAIIAAAMLMNKTQAIGTVVHASEPEWTQEDPAVKTDGQSTREEQQMHTDGQSLRQEAETEVNVQPAREEPETAESAHNTREENGIQTDEQENQEATVRIQDHTEEELKLNFEEQTLCETAGGVTFRVAGCMPENSRLCVDAETLEGKGTAYSLTVLYADGVYHPEKYGRTLELSVEVLSRGRSREEKVYTIYEGDDLNQLGIVKEGRAATFTTDRLSRYVIIEDVNYQGETQWQFDYNGNSQSFVVPVTGVYRFDLYGAQGSDYREHQGGKGGMVSVQLELTRNEEVELVIGGENGFHGGGTGTLSNGGGATRLIANGVTAAIAGGGGGATDLLDGGDGGDTRGTGANHDTGDSSDESNTAGGGAGYLGGMSGYTGYHVHTGSPAGGGCYTSEVKHVHSEECNTVCGTYGEFCISQSNPGYINAYCDKCGAWGCRQGDMNSPFVMDGSWKHSKQVCGKNPDVVEYYDLGCGKQTTTVESKVMAYGGSSYYDSAFCRKGVMVKGVQEGNGKVLVNMLEMDGATLSYYDYDMRLLGSITVAKGDKADYPLTSIPRKDSNNKYSYEFTGWDAIQTDERETMPDSLTVQDAVVQDRDYIATYRNIPRKYTVTLEDDGATVQGTQTVTAVYGSSMPDIEIPRKEGYLFAGYYTGPQGAGVQYYTESGESARSSGMTKDTVLYACWVQPLTITEQPVDLMEQAGYCDAIMEINYTQSLTDGYEVGLQWYVEHNGKIQPVADATSKQLRIPENYETGTYQLWCELKVTSHLNGQTMTFTTDKAQFRVMLHFLQNKDVVCSTPKVEYDGKSHLLSAKVDSTDELSVYYGEQPLNQDNYYIVGTKKAYSYQNAGIYKVYLYITGVGYEDYAGSIHMEIMKSKWRIEEDNYPVLHKNGTVTFPGGESWEYDADGGDTVSYHHYEPGTKLPVGDYLFRIEEDENHYASDAVKLTRNPAQEGSHNGNQGSGSNNNRTETGSGDVDQTGNNSNNGQQEHNSNGQTGTGNSDYGQAGTGNSSYGQAGTGNSDYGQAGTANSGYGQSENSGIELRSTAGGQENTSGAENAMQEDAQVILSGRPDHGYEESHMGSVDNILSGIVDRTRGNEIGIREDTQVNQSDLRRAKSSFAIGIMILFYLMIALLLFFALERNAGQDEEEIGSRNKRRSHQKNCRSWISQIFH